MPTKHADLTPEQRARYLERKNKKYAEDKAYRAAHHAYAKTRRSAPETWLLVVLQTTKSRLKGSETPFDITAADIPLPTHCPVIGEPFVFGHSGHNPLSPSLDRLRPELGYVKGNVRVISKRANMIKQDCTDPAVFERLAAYVRGEI